ncbi:MAG: Methionine transporter ATP-binding protein [bacterium]|nr:Methionine transporter ATP-binding protein [bacterium]
MTGPPLIAFRDVRKRFGDKVVLDGVDLDVLPRETIAILGPSGAGKTVLLKSLVGLTRVDDGVVRFEDVDLAHADERQFRSIRARIGFVFQASALFDSISVADNVGYALRVRAHADARRIAARVAECLALVGLSGTEPLLPSELSGGMRKRVAVARALATRPQVLLYDEPTTGLDPANVQRIARLINRVRDSQQTTGLVVTHDRELAFAVADRLALLMRGRIAWIGSNDEARQTPPALAAFWSGEGAEERP